MGFFPTSALGLQALDGERGVVGGANGKGLPQKDG